MRGPGYSRLWDWFGLSRASFLILPRALMHEMPDDWQARMAELLDEWDREHERIDTSFDLHACAKRGGKHVAIPSILTGYRHPDRAGIAGLKLGVIKL